MPTAVSISLVLYWHSKFHYYVVPLYIYTSSRWPSIKLKSDCAGADHWWKRERERVGECWSGNGERRSERASEEDKKSPEGCIDLLSGVLLWRVRAFFSRWGWLFRITRACNGVEIFQQLGIRILACIYEISEYSMRSFILLWLMNYCK